MKPEFKTYLKDLLWFTLFAAIIYVIYLIIAYWPEIVQGFNSGWDMN